MGTLHEYREFPDNSIESVGDTGACCQNCGSRDVLKEYLEHPDGSLVYVRDTAVCCGCASNHVLEYKLAPDGSVISVRDTGACCNCEDATTADCHVHCNADFPAALVLATGTLGFGTIFDNHTWNLTLTSSNAISAQWETPGKTYGSDGYATVIYQPNGRWCQATYEIFKLSGGVIHSLSSIAQVYTSGALNFPNCPPSSGPPPIYPTAALFCPFKLCWCCWSLDAANPLCSDGSSPCPQITAS